MNQKFEKPYMRLKEIESLGISRTVIESLQAAGKSVMFKQNPAKRNSPYIVNTLELAKCLEARTKNIRPVKGGW